MPDYIPQLLERLNYITPPYQQDSPFPAPNVAYGSKVQYTVQDESLPLEVNGIRLVQSIVGAVLYYGRMIDNTILVACNDIASQQASATEKTLKLTTWLLDYLATHPKAKITFKKSDI